MPIAVSAGRPSVRVITSRRSAVKLAGHVEAAISAQKRSTRADRGRGRRMHDGRIVGKPSDVRGRDSRPGSRFVVALRSVEAVQRGWLEEVLACMTSAAGVG
jgi:hypothetical protein